MDARVKSLLLLAMLVPTMGAASARSKNFIVTAPTPALAAEIAQNAERFRQELSMEWLGHELPDWREPCPIVAHVDGRPAQGRTSFIFDGNRPYGWDMEVIGSRERILDSVLPHEITHTIFATHFGRPLPRWADEGGSTTVEHYSERKKQHLSLIRFLKTDKGIPFNQLFAMTEYPREMLPLYAQGYSLTRFLIAQGGKQKFVDFIGAGMDHQNWAGAVQQHYGYRSLGDLQLAWVDWVVQGSRPDLAGQGIQVASAGQGQNNSSAARAESAQGPITLAANTTESDTRPARGRAPVIDHDATESFDDVQLASAPNPPGSGRSYYARREQAAEPSQVTRKNGTTTGQHDDMPTRPMPAAPAVRNASRADQQGWRRVH